jgi:hypothetical protein
MDSYAEPLEPLLAGTLALLHLHATHEGNTPLCPRAAYKLALNLHRLANHPAWSEAMATVLARLSGAWRERAYQGALADADGAITPAVAPTRH